MTKSSRQLKAWYDEACCSGVKMGRRLLETLASTMPAPESSMPFLEFLQTAQLLLCRALGLRCGTLDTSTYRIVICTGSRTARTVVLNHTPMPHTACCIIVETLVRSATGVERISGK
jgi:hypothetical protein